MGRHMSPHGDAHFSKMEMQHSPKMSATFSKKDLTYMEVLEQLMTIEAGSVKKC